MKTTTPLTKAFSELRKAGFWARQSFTCCNSCAGYEVAQVVEKMSEDQRASFKGVVYYTRQGAASLREDGYAYLSYGPVSLEGVGEVGLPTAEAGKIIQSILENHSIGTVWNGDPNECIEITC